VKRRLLNLRRADHRGFTMIELIVALAMVAIIAASLSSVLWTAYHATRNTEADVAPSVQASIALDYISQDLKNAIQPNITITTGTALAGDFEGTQASAGNGQEGDDIVLYSTADSAQHIDANGEIKRIEYTIVQPTGSSDYVLVRRVTRNLLADVQPAPDEEIICRGVKSFTLQYYDGSNWNPTWDSTQEDNTIPAAVQLTLELQETPVNGKPISVRYTRIIYLSASTASLDPQVNSGVSGL
jgi:type II secretion system protein J